MDRLVDRAREVPTEREIAAALQSCVGFGLRADKIRRTPLLLSLNSVQKLAADRTWESQVSAADAVIRAAVVRVETGTKGDRAKARAKRRAFELLLALGLEHLEANVEKRRKQAREILAVRCGAEHWRKVAEKAFFRELARQILFFETQSEIDKVVLEVHAKDMENNHNEGVEAPAISIDVGDAGKLTWRALIGAIRDLERDVLEQIDEHQGEKLEVSYRFIRAE